MISSIRNHWISVAVDRMARGHRRQLRGLILSVKGLSLRIDFEIFRGKQAINLYICIRCTKHSRRSTDTFISVEMLMDLPYGRRKHVREFNRWRNDE